MDRQDIAGPTFSFSNTILAATVDGEYTELPYRILLEQPVELFQVRYGGFLIALTNTREEAEQHQKWHSRLMSNYGEHRLIQESIGSKQSRMAAGKAIEKALTELSLRSILPGTCEYCT